MPITDFLERNAHLFGDEVCLVEINPKVMEHARVTWREYSLIETNPMEAGRTEITWREFDKRANRFANLLLSRGIKKGDKVAILLMNCLEWLPIYFGILKAGAVAVPLNYRYTAEEIKYCVELAQADVLVFGPEFIGRVEEICYRMPRVKQMFYVGSECPTFAESYDYLVKFMRSIKPDVEYTDDDNAAIYFHRVQQDFQRQFYMHTEVLSMLQGLSRCTTVKNMMMYFCAYRPFTTQVQKCTGSEVL